LNTVFSDEKKYFSHVDQQFKSKLHRYVVKQYIGIDLDTKDKETYIQIMTDITEYVNVYVVIETRGGYHIIISQTGTTKNKKRSLCRSFPIHMSS
jgi:hypothetical protein